jgi:hypothetical protein
MNVLAMLNRLRHRLEDPNDRTWEADDKIDALIDAESIVLSRVRPEIVKQVLGTTADQTLAGSVPNTTFPADLFRDAITSITYSAFANYAFKLIDRDDSAKYTNKFLVPSRRKPIGFVDNNVFYSLVPNDAGQSVKLNYIRQPKTLVLNSPGTGEVDTSELPENLHVLICLVAESICWRADDEPERVALSDRAAEVIFQDLVRRETASEVKKDERPNR